MKRIRRVSKLKPMLADAKNWYPGPPQELVDKCDAGKKLVCAFLAAS
ncbi:MAG: hypothetical protein IT365_10925 [Candidatus Hydrogenedentes bacterium]|nr:hypothetical protein [Candidatus Hydrogenedentota bacterium]